MGLKNRGCWAYRPSPPQDHQQHPSLERPLRAPGQSQAGGTANILLATLPGTSHGTSVPTHWPRNPFPLDTGRTEMDSKMEKPGSNWTDIDYVFKIVYINSWALDFILSRAKIIKYF